MCHQPTIIKATGDAQIAESDRGVLVTASIFKMMLGPNETIDPEEPSGHGLGPIVKVRALDTVEGIGVQGAHRSVVLYGRIIRLTQDIWQNGVGREKS